MVFTALSLHEPMSKKQKYVFVTSFLPVIVSFFFFLLKDIFSGKGKCLGHTGLHEAMRQIETLSSWLSLTPCI